MASVAARKSVKDAVARYVQGRLKEETAKERGMAARIAKATGFSTAHVANAKNKGAIGQDFAEAMARFWGMTYADLTRVAQGQEPTGEPVEVIELEDRYANRAEAARFARKSGIDEEAIRVVQSQEHDSPVDPPPIYWLDQMRTVADRLKWERVDPLGAAREREQSQQHTDAMREELRKRREGR